MSKPISQSEADSFLSCKRRHYYAHGEGIAPKAFSPALTRGTMGHAVLDAYYSSLKEGESRATAESKGREVLTQFFEPANVEEITKLSLIFNDYFKMVETTQAGWTILEVEKEYRVPVPGTDMLFPFKIDLMIKDAHGRKILIDNKFVQDFYSPELIGILPQLTKYAGALEMVGEGVDLMAYNMLRTRPLKNGSLDDKFRFQEIKPNKTKTEQYMREQFSTMRQIEAVRTRVTMEEWEANYALRSANQFNCRMCPFLELCYKDLINAPGRELFIETFFEPNTYGYDRDVKEKS